MLSPQEQLQYELENDTNAAAAKLENLRKSALAGDIELPKCKRLMAAAFNDVKTYIEAVQLSKTRGVGGKHRTWIKALPSDVLAALSIRTCLRICSSPVRDDKPATIQLLAGTLGRLIETERRILEAEKLNPLYMQRVHQRVQDQHSVDTKYLRAVYLAAYREVIHESADTHLSQSETVQVGKFGVEACMEAGLLTCRHTVGSKGRLVIYELTPEIEEALLDYDEDDVRLVHDIAASAMLAPPLPWMGLNNGGYYSPRRQATMPLMSLGKIRKSERLRIREEFTPAKMPEVFECANYLQSIPLEVHRPTLEAIRKLWANGGGVLGVPNRNPPKVPEFPLAADWKKGEATGPELDIFHNWCAEARQAYTSMASWRSRTREVAGFLRHSSRHEAGTPMWFPVFFDTRGRWYYRGSPNPQGSDLSKAILHLHRKKPLGQEGLFWLKVAVANNAGFDKARFKKRAKWTEENWEAIERALEAPEDYPEVWGTDAPWCMFSAAWELREALRSGNPEQYMTGIIVHMDATCSGIQHLSAILRDPVGGKFVNLYDEDPEFMGPKQDIYGKVAHHAYQSVTADLDSSDQEVRQCAQFWSSMGPIERAMAKKPVNIHGRL